MEIYKITEEYLSEVINTNSRALVGEIMKRFEVLEKKEDIKKVAKEKIYEKFRTVKNELKLSARGMTWKPREKE